MKLIVGLSVLLAFTVRVEFSVEKIYPDEYFKLLKIKKKNFFNRFCQEMGNGCQYSIKSMKKTQH